ncbi:MAG TPA: YibE/F family protein, partial [Gaiellaceae bacterium]|nr:YibE/F family protein [Gaiellaceae bacterium]
AGSPSGLVATMASVAEAPDPAFWREEPRRLGVVTIARGIVVVLAAATLVGLWVLWPHGGLKGSSALTVRTDGATVTDVVPIGCPGKGQHDCRRVDFRLASGRLGSFTIVGRQGGLALSLGRGDKIRVYPNRIPAGTPPAVANQIGRWSFSDFDRRGALLSLAATFLVLLLLTGRLRGLRAVLGLVASLVVVVEFVIPAVLHGRNPVEVAIVGSFAVMLLTMPLAYGLGVKTTAALLGTGASLLAAAGLADFAARLAHLSGANEEALYLVSTSSTLSLRGLLVAGMVIGALGVLVDLTVSQASTVLALRRANPRLGFGGLFRGALDVGHDHIAATVNTLVFAYAGAALPVLLIFSIGHTPFTDAINSEVVAQEVVASLVGSIGLILSMPLTTALAALLVERVDPSELAHEHVHEH